MNHLREVKPNGTPHWLLFLLHTAETEGAGPLTAKELAARVDWLDRQYAATGVTNLYEVGGLDREKLTDRPYNPYGYTLAQPGRDTLAALGAPSFTPPVHGRDAQPVNCEFTVEPQSEDSVIPQTVAGPNGERIERNQTPHWVLFLLAQADAKGTTPIPPDALCSMDDALNSEHRVTDVFETFSDRGWATKARTTDYKHNPNGWTLTDRGEEVLLAAGAPTHYPESQTHSGESVNRSLPPALVAQGRDATPADATCGATSLEPDWEWLADQLAALSQYELAAKARDGAFTPREVYGPGGVLDILYGEQEMQTA